MQHNTRPIAETPDYIVLDQYTSKKRKAESYQSEDELERNFVRDLINQGYTYRKDITTPGEMLANVRSKIEKLNSTAFTDPEWQRFVENYLDKPSEGHVEKTRKVHEDYIKDFVFDDGRIENIYLFNKELPAQNNVEVIKQFEQTGTHDNRYDVTVLVNGLPLAHIELKKRGEPIKQAFNQIHRYSKESFNSDNSLYKFIQIFVISNGTDTRYFANTTKRNKDSFDFTINWARSDNTPIKDLEDFTATFFQKHTLLDILFRYSVLDATNTLLVMRPYQIAATERILWKIKSSHLSRTWSKPESGGYIWHSTGSGKTLTSFKTAQLATKLDFIDKVIFVVDRKDLDYQTMKEYQRFSPDSVNGSKDTAGLKSNLTNDDNKIVVTTIQKLNNLLKKDEALAIYGKHVVFIFDECHRSQFGEAQNNLKKRFKKYYQFGFTGTPIFAENTLGGQTTESVFGQNLHSYIIINAIRDENVLKFKVDYNDVRPQFRALEKEQNLDKLSAAENKKSLLHPKRIEEVSQYILQTFPQKTQRTQTSSKGFNAMFAMSSVEAAKLYYEALNNLQADSKKPLRIATIYSYAANEEQDAVGDIKDESFDITAMDSTAKEFLQKAADDYNSYFNTTFTIDSKGFQNYYRDLAKRVRSQEIDLLIVVGMFLTGFDAPQLNTLYVDKNLRYHGLIQAFSRTNRIYDATKTFGNIVCFRDLQKATIDAISLFGDDSTKTILLERSYKDYMYGYTDQVTGTYNKGYLALVAEIQERFPDPSNIDSESEKKAFAKLFGQFLRLEAILKNYDEFVAFKSFQEIDKTDTEALEIFKQKYHLDDKNLEDMNIIEAPSTRTIQDYKSTYNDIHDWIEKEQKGREAQESKIDWNDVVFEIELLDTDEINFDYISALINKHKSVTNKDNLINDVTKLIKSSPNHRAKEGLYNEFLTTYDLAEFEDASAITEALIHFARKKQLEEIEALISSEGLNPEAARHFIISSINQDHATDNGDELNAILPKMSPLNPEFRKKKTTVFSRIKNLVDIYRGVGG